ncbi:Major facilitator superfamily, partial [Trypanosoma melophagium]|uniref:Major facilitator superfamily n=1 Tax=Trypanosoma melophagium TaxID=715481 RepID=UPI00351A708E
MPLWESQTREVERRKAAGLPPVDEMKRFRILVCCMFCSICTSIVYAFDLFTTEFSDRFHLSAGDQSTISTVGLVFCYFTLPYGFLYDYAGPFPLFMICILTGGLGSLLLGLTFDGLIPGNVVNISVFYALVNTCSGLIDVAYIVTLAEAFPRNRGPVIALAKVMTTLGSSVLASLSVNIFNNISSFIYFLMALSIVVSSVAAFVVVLPPYFINGWRRRGKTPEQLAVLTALKPAYYQKFVPVRRLALGYVIVAALLVFFTVVTPVVSYTEMSRGSSIAIGIITIVLVSC